MKNRSTLHRLAFLSASVALWFVLSAQTAPADKARQEKAREYLQLAQDNLAKSPSDLADMGRGDVCIALANLGELDAAKKSAAAINFLKVETQTAVARIEARGNNQNALQYLRTLVSPRTSSLDDLATVAEAQADLGDSDGARQLAAAMKPSWQQAKAYCAVARAQAKAGDLPAAIKTFATANAALKGNTDPYPWFRASDLACAQLEAGDTAGARQTTAAISDPGEKATAYAALAALAASKPDKAPARELLELARNALDNKPPVGALIALARAYTAAGDKDTAKTLLTQARTAADAGDHQREMYPETLASIALTQRATGDAAGSNDTMKAAMAALEKIPNSGNRTHALWVIASAQANAGDTIGARQSVALAVKDQIDPAETAMQAAGVARAMARAAGPTADLAWIAQLPTPQEKGLAYAGAAAGLSQPAEIK